ncbi:MAG: hypothetical protein ACRC62_15990 [Microcoleus sp.]
MTVFTSKVNCQLSTKRAGTGAPPLPINDRLSIDRERGRSH